MLIVKVKSCLLNAVLAKKKVWRPAHWRTGFTGTRQPWVNCRSLDQATQAVKGRMFKVSKQVCAERTTSDSNKRHGFEIIVGFRCYGIETKSDPIKWNCLNNVRSSRMVT
jgi:hypothetical protein